MTIEVLDPSWEEGGAAEFSRAPRPGALEGLTVGVISNGKQGTRPFFEALARELESGFGAARVELLTKVNYSAPAEAEVMGRAREWDALVSGIGD